MPRQASKKIACTVVVGPGAGQYYGTLVTDNIRYEDGTPVTIQKFLGVKFKSPFIEAAITVNPLLNPWQPTSPEISTEQIDDKTINVTAKIHVEQSHTFKLQDTLTWGINGNLTIDPERYTASFELYADELPSGTVKVECASSPDAALAGVQQVVYLEQDGQPTTLSVSPGETKPFQVASGNYAVKADELTNAEETVVAPARVSHQKVTVKTGETTGLTVAYDAVQKYCALDVDIGQLSPPINREQLHVNVVERSTGQTLADFLSPNNHKSDLRRLPSSGNADINAQITLNNVRHFAAKPARLANDLIRVAINQSDVQTESIDTSGFVDLPVEVHTEINKPAAAISVRLTSTARAVVYSQTFPASRGRGKFAVKVAPGEYTVHTTGFLDNETVYAVQGPATLTVAPGGSTKLELTVRRGANLSVRGFPNFLSFGALSDLVDLEGEAFVAARASSLFKYAGNDGAGDSGLYLPDDPATTKTIELAAHVESKLGSGHSVLPVMISYTNNLSLGDIHSQLQNEKGLAHSFGNLILSLNIAKQKGKKPVPAGYIVNADFLGECQKGPDGSGLSPSYSMPVREPLQEALDHWNINATIPSNVVDTLKGYVFAVNWLIRTIAQEVTFGWQVNVWGVGNSTWIYSRDPKAESPAEMARRTADFIKTLAVYSGECAPDFLAIDRYEADDFTQRAYVNSYCYGPYEWGRFFDFCSGLSLELQVPVMPWQIPASRIPRRTESVDHLEVEQWGSGGTYLFGDAGINTDYHNIHPTVLAIKPSALVPHKNVEEIFASAQPFDLSYPAYLDFPMRGIFAVLLGGGATTGIVTSIGKTGPWTQEKLKAYIESPIPFRKASSR